MIKKYSGFLTLMGYFTLVSIICTPLIIIIQDKCEEGPALFICISVSVAAHFLIEILTLVRDRKRREIDKDIVSPWSTVLCQIVKSIVIAMILIMFLKNASHMFSKDTAILTFLIFAFVYMLTNIGFTEMANNRFNLISGERQRIVTMNELLKAMIDDDEEQERTMGGDKNGNEDE